MTSLASSAQSVVRRPSNGTTPLVDLSLSSVHHWPHILTSYLWCLLLLVLYKSLFEYVLPGQSLFSVSCFGISLSAAICQHSLSFPSPTCQPSPVAPSVARQHRPPSVSIFSIATLPSASSMLASSTIPRSAPLPLPHEASPSHPHTQELVTCLTGWFWAAGKSSSYYLLSMKVRISIYFHVFYCVVAITNLALETPSTFFFSLSLSHFILFYFKVKKKIDRRMKIIREITLPTHPNRSGDMKTWLSPAG